MRFREVFSLRQIAAKRIVPIPPGVDLLEAYAAERSCRRQEGAAFPPVTASASSPHGYTPTSPPTRPLPDTPDGDRAT